MVSMALVIAALVLFILSASNVPSRVNLQSAGLACYVASLLAGNIFK